MSDQNGYIKDEDLHTLSKEELVGRLISARQYYRDDQATIESLTDQVGKAVGDIEKLNALIEERDTQIERLHALLGEVEDINMKVLCRVNHASKILNPYQIPEDTNGKGGQHASAPSK